MCASYKAGCVEMRRTQVPFRKFHAYRQSAQRLHGVFRPEVQYGRYYKAHQKQDHTPIIAVFQNALEAVPQATQKLILWYDKAVTRTGEIA